MAVKVYQRSFNGGEVAPSLYARIDDGKYQTGLATCKNFLVEPQGPITMRPGFAYVNKTKQQDQAPRLIPFTYSNDQTMVLEFGDKYIRFHTQGQTLLDSDGDPYEVETPYSIDDVFDIHYVQSGDVLTLVHPSYHPAELRRYGAADWRLEQINFASVLSAPTNLKVTTTGSGGGKYTREYAVTALLSDGSQESARSESFEIDCYPYGDGAYNTITWDAVDGAGLYRVYRNEGGIWGYIGQTDGLSIKDENIDPDASITPPIYDDVFLNAGGISSVEVLTQGEGYYGTRGVSLVPNTIFVNIDPYDMFEGVYHDQDTWPILNVNSGTIAANAGTLNAFPEFYFPAIFAPSVFSVYAQQSYRVYDIEGNGTGAVVRCRWSQTGYNDWYSRLDSVEILSSGSGYIKPRLYFWNLCGPNQGFVAAYCDLGVQGSAETVTLEVEDETGSGAVLRPVISDGKIIAVNVVSGGSGYTNPTIKVVSESGSGATFKVNVSETGDYPSAVSYFEQRRWFAGTYTKPSNMWATKSGTESDMSFSLPSQDDDRIAVRVAARDANRIQHIVPLQQLMTLTAAAEWRISPLNSDAITPSSMSVRPQSYIGANNVQPLVVANTMIYAASRGGHLRECGYSYEAGGYISNDVCLRASHLFDNDQIVDLAYAKAPWPIVWAVNDKGNLIAMTYVPEQQVGGFNTIETDNGLFRSCCVVAEGEEDILYCVVERIITGRKHYYIERMNQRQYTTLDRSVFLDSSGTYVGDATTEVSGLDWLEGQRVCVVSDGSVEGYQFVENGKVTLKMPSNYVHVGIPFTADAKTLPVAVALQDGGYGSGHEKNVRSISLRVINSSGIKAGPDFDNLTEYPARSIEYAGNPPDPINDEIDLPIVGVWNKYGQVCIRQENPLPLKIISVTTTVEIS
nr:MAG TPA: stabilization protein [Caudoviricetes sp.]